MLIVALLGLYLLSDYTGYKYDETEGVEETTAQETRPDDDGWSWKEYKGNGDHEDVGDGAGDGGGSGQEQPIIRPAEAVTVTKASNQRYYRAGG